MCVCWTLTPGVTERCFSGLASIAALVWVEGCALLPAASHHLHVPADIFRFSQSLQAVQLPAACVRQVERLVHRVHRQVVLMSRTGAEGREFKQGFMTKHGYTHIGNVLMLKLFQKSKSIPKQPHTESCSHKVRVKNPSRSQCLAEISIILNTSPDQNSQPLQCVGPLPAYNLPFLSLHPVLP